MAKAEKCSVCGLFYNEEEYGACPYCSDQARGTAAPKKRPSGLFGKIRSGIRSGAAQGQAPAAPSGPKTYDPDRTLGPDFGSAPRPQPAPPAPRPQPVSPVPPRPVTPQPEPKAVEPRRDPTPQPKAAPSLEEEIVRGRRTVGKYISAKDGTAIAPVVGWIVGVQGDNYGRSFPLKSGKNRVGRSHEMDVKLMNDDSVSRSCVAVIVYDRKANAFSVLPGESDSLCYLNGEAVYGRETLRGYDLLEFGDSELNKYLFVPLCGEQFRWKQAEEKPAADAAEQEESSNEV